MTPLPLIHPAGDCSGCGMCCAEIGTPPFTHTEGDEPPPHLAWDFELHEWRGEQGLPCLWFDPAARTCLHYADRPQVCREFAVGSHACRRWRHLGRKCESPPPADEEDGY